MLISKKKEEKGQNAPPKELFSWTHKSSVFYKEIPLVSPQLPYKETSTGSRASPIVKAHLIKQGTDM